MFFMANPLCMASWNVSHVLHVIAHVDGMPLLSSPQVAPLLLKGSEQQFGNKVPLVYSLFATCKVCGTA